MNYSHKDVHLKPSGTEVKNTPLGRSHWNLRSSSCVITVCDGLSSIRSSNVRIGPVQSNGEDVIFLNSTAHVDYSWNEVARQLRRLKGVVLE